MSSQTKRWRRNYISLTKQCSENFFRATSNLIIFIIYMIDNELINRLNILNMSSRKNKSKKKAVKNDINIIEQKNFDEKSSMNFVIFIQQKSERLHHVEQKRQHREKQKLQHHHESLKSSQKEFAVFTSLSSSFMKFRQSFNEIITKITFNFIVDNIQALYQSQEALKSWDNTLINDVIYNYNKLGIILDIHDQRLKQIKASL